MYSSLGVVPRCRNLFYIRNPPWLHVVFILWSVKDFSYDQDTLNTQLNLISKILLSIKTCIFARIGDSRQSKLEILPCVLSTDWQPAAGQGTNHSSRQ